VDTVTDVDESDVLRIPRVCPTQLPPKASVADRRCVLEQGRACIVAGSLSTTTHSLREFCLAQVSFHRRRSERAPDCAGVGGRGQFGRIKLQLTTSRLESSIASSKPERNNGNCFRLEFTCVEKSVIRRAGDNLECVGGQPVREGKIKMHHRTRAHPRSYQSPSSPCCHLKLPTS
jgi:hypothetical protein